MQNIRTSIKKKHTKRKQNEQHRLCEDRAMRGRQASSCRDVGRPGSLHPARAWLHLPFEPLTSERKHTRRPFVVLPRGARRRPTATGRGTGARVAQDSGGGMERSWRLATARQAGPAAWVKLELGDGTALLLCMQPVLRPPAAEDPPPYERRQPKIPVVFDEVNQPATRLAAVGRPGHLDAAASPGPRLTWRARDLGLLRGGIGRLRSILIHFIFG